MSAEQKLRLLHAKKERLFARVQTICSHASQTKLDSFKELFLNEIETVDDLRLDFEKVLDDINILELEGNPKYVINYQQLSSFEDMYGQIKRVSKQLSPPAPVMALPATHVPSTSGRTRLPPIELPEFNGDLKSWPLFYTSFNNTVHLNLSLSSAEKLYYLLGKLTGKAQTVFAGITPSADNYQLIYQSLVNKYEDKRMLASSYLDQIFDVKPVSSATAANLELFLDKFSSSFAALKNLDIKDLTDYIFLYMALKKLDSETVRAFELDNRTQTIPSFDNLVTFVRDNIKILYRTQTNNRQLSNRSDTTTTKATKPTHVYVNTSSSQSPSHHREKCILCNSYHDQLYSCLEFQKLTPVERFRFIKSNNLCLNCFNNNHHFTDCKSKYSCRECNKRHHSMLHFEPTTTLDKNETRSNQPSRSIENYSQLVNQSGNSTSLPTEITLCTLSSSESNLKNNNSLTGRMRASTVLLGTAVVVVVDKHGSNHNVRVLLDSASQSNFVTRTCYQRLGLNNFNKLNSFTVKGIGGSTKIIQGSTNLKFFSRFDRNINFNMETLVVDKITECLPTTAVDASFLSNFNTLPTIISMCRVKLRCLSGHQFFRTFYYLAGCMVTLLISHLLLWKPSWVML